MADKKPILKVGNDTEKAIFNHGQYYIHIQHIPSGAEVQFKAFITQFEDQFSSEWNTERTFGRMDPIRSFRGTQRIISLGWDVVADGIEEAHHNLKNCSTLLSMLYPSYDQTPSTIPAAPGGKQQESAQKNVTTQKSLTTQNNASTIMGAPLFRLKFGNLIQSARYNAQGSGIASGLIGTIDGLTYSPDIEQGFFDPAPGILYPQTIKLAFGFYVAHDHPLGWSDGQRGKFLTNAGNEDIGPSFPRNADEPKKKGGR